MRVLLLLGILIATCTAFNNEIQNSPPSDESGNTAENQPMFPRTNLIGMSIAILACIVLIIISIAAAHYGRIEKEKEEQAIEDAKKLEVDRYEGARVYELTKIGV
ncbi:cadherin-17 [Acrasis kona]|uniref:Cadherin-17 n=1 Tax=Acrasis kona TaxID=1008807 RepID=A0AAW2YPK5_9EUKA